MQINQDDYHVHYDAELATVTCNGTFRLRGSEEYQPILDVLLRAADDRHATLALDVRELQFLNSSGINTLSKFVLHVRKLNATQVLIKGSVNHPWQAKSLKNFQRLLPALQLEIV